MTNQTNNDAPTNHGPLAGIRVLELGSLIAGPFASRMLGEFGAEVIKVETPGSGDPIRKWRVLHEGNSLWWAVQARNKKSITLNLKAEEGLAVLRKLIESADMLVENFRPGQLEKWGLSPEQLQAINPGLIVVRLSGYGQTGPYKDRPGFGAIAESIGGNGDAIFKRLMVAIGRTDFAENPDMASNDGRVRHTELIDNTIAQWCKERSIDEALEVLEKADVPVSKIYSIEDIVRDPQFAARGMIEEHAFGEDRTLKVPGIVPKLSDTPGQTRWLGPKLGEHNAQVLAELGYSAEDIQRMADEGVI